MLSRFLRKAQGSQWSTREMVVADLIRAVARIPRTELPDGAARDALIEAIRCGEVIGVYTPHACHRYNIELAGMPRGIDPRITAAQWRAWWDAGKHPTDAHVAERRAEQLQARLELQGDLTHE